MKYKHTGFNDAGVVYPIEGDIIVVDGRDYVVSEALQKDIPFPCASCAFNDENVNQVCVSVKCREYERKDGRWMIFTLVD